MNLSPGWRGPSPSFSPLTSWKGASTFQPSPSSELVGENESLTAAEWLVRSGAMGLVIIDAEGQWNLSDSSLGRILKVAERSLCAVIFLTRKRPRDPSLGSRISLRGCIMTCIGDPFTVNVHTIKDKRANLSSRQRRHYHGPSGMYQH
ncbi:MAG: hypothetical protein ACLQCB_21315 [Spirochaetia bacterium]